MKRLFALVFLLAAGGAFAQEVSYGQAELAYFKLRDANGMYTTYRSGGKIPIRIRKIDAEVRQTADGGVKFNGGIPMPGGFGRPKASQNQLVFSNNAGANWVAADGPSCLDDLVLTAAGNNKAWKIVTFGVCLVGQGRTGKFLVRWRGYDTYTPNLGQGVMAFSGEFFDAGFYLDRSQFLPTGEENQTYEVGVDLTLSPIFIVPNQTCFLAQQFREPHPGGPSQENGEGPFTNVWNTFTDNGPQIGQSEDLFWYDVPPDGIYDETEPDNFGSEAPGAGTFKFEVEVGSGNTQTMSPFAFSWFRGQPLAGSLGNLWFDDQTYCVARAGVVLVPTEAPAQLIVETFSPTFNPAGLRFDAQAKVNTPGLAMRIDMFNFQTNQYVNVWTNSAGTADTTGVGFAANPPQFVQPGTGIMRSRVSFFRTGVTLIFPWAVSVDMVRWTLTT